MQVDAEHRWKDALETVYPGTCFKPELLSEGHHTGISGLPKEKYKWPKRPVPPCKDEDAAIVSFLKDFIDKGVVETLEDTELKPREQFIICGILLFCVSNKGKKWGRLICDFSMKKATNQMTRHGGDGDVRNVLQRILSFIHTSQSVYRKPHPSGRPKYGRNIRNQSQFHIK